ncbi:DUF692 domain-containing protein [Bauldia sp.]|uniref:MNIO family bufferin maturase n=1 Tax=Bauldia sp. TaxID=2575872 RepID=UPI003BAD8867
MAFSPTQFSRDPIPPRVGVGLKPEHYGAILEGRPDIGWFEVHAENYMGAGGPPHRHLTAIRELYPLSLHGVGLSIGAARDLDRDHLARLKMLNDQYEPGLFSEHLAWSTHDSVFLSDLLPIPYDEESLARVAGHIDQVQETVGRRMLLENPSTYVAFKESTIGEIDFLSEIAKRTGCGLLLDVNNVHVSCTNQRWDAIDYLNRFPMHLVGEIHMAGYAPSEDDHGDPLLIDAHDRPADPQVVELYDHAIALAGPIPTLVEWDNDVPDWPTLYAEATRVEAVLTSHQKQAKTDAALAV